MNTLKELKIGIIGSFTLNGLDTHLKTKCLENGINSEIYFGGYKQYQQEILDSNSGLYEFNPDITFLILDTRSLFDRYFYYAYSIDSSEREKFVKEKLNEIKTLITNFTKNTKSKLIITNLNITRYSPYGIAESKMKYGFYSMIRDFNYELENLSRSEHFIHILDYDGFVSKYGEKNVFDHRLYFIGDIKISLKFMAHFADEIMAFIKPIVGLNKKCIVLDLDNTLWGGIIGEDGFEDIKLGHTPPGNTFIEFQKRLLALWQRGILLAINSKNNFDEAIRVIRDHPYMILREENFASIKINWDDKVENMKSIATELNLGLDSLIFFDDDPINRENVKKRLPQVKTVTLPTDPSEFAPILENIDDFNTLAITEEDLKRGLYYTQQKERLELEKTSSSFNDFLNELGIRITIKAAQDFTIPRISQLTLKTNQFNLTTKRYQEEDIRRMSNDQNYHIGCAEVEDKFGNNGITNVFIIKKDNTDEWSVDTFLLSCRIMGRKIEDGILAYIVNKARKEGVKIIKAQYVPTSKNSPCQNFLSNFGFKKDGDHYIMLLNNDVKIPECLKLEEENAR